MALSTMEAEYMEMSEAIKECVHLPRFPLDFDEKDATNVAIGASLKAHRYKSFTSSWTLYGT